VLTPPPPTLKATLTWQIEPFHLQQCLSSLQSAAMSASKKMSASQRKAKDRENKKQKFNESIKGLKKLQIVQQSTAVSCSVASDSDDGLESLLRDHKKKLCSIHW
jgi:hypothetical protein